MTFQFRARQAWTVAKIELRRAFFSRRAFWVYLLALFPVLIFGGRAIEVKVRKERWIARGVTAAALIDSAAPGAAAEEVLGRLGPPLNDFQWTERRRRDEGEEAGAPGREGRRAHRRMLYFDGERTAWLSFENGILARKRVRTLLDFSEDRLVYAGVFQFFYLRLAIFFGCLGIFMNMFRGEILDKTLHFWFLAPVRRDVLLAGKYMAGLIAASAIFTTGAMLSFYAMLWPHGAAEVQAYWQGPGLGHALLYAAASILGCVGYGSVFLAAGLLLRNPIVPAAVLLVWESIGGFLPQMLQKLSVLYYLQSICPVAAPVDSGAPALVRVFLSPAEPAPRAAAALGLAVLTALVLWAGSRAVKRIEINYGAE
jgi:ABC-type transport system involved in multi-copper enzyme maturation permease subunit